MPPGEGTRVLRRARGEDGPREGWGCGVVSGLGPCDLRVHFLFETCYFNQNYTYL